jgi:hypothetical protein
MSIQMKSKDSTSPKLRYFVRSNYGEIFDGPFRSLQEIARCIAQYRAQFRQRPIITRETIECQDVTWSGNAVREADGM